MRTRQEKLQMWLACVLTAGEWAIALTVLIHNGDLVMIYLAITYLVRETRGGQEYHHVVCQIFHKVFTRE